MVHFVLHVFTLYVLVWIVCNTNKIIFNHSQLVTQVFCVHAVFKSLLISLSLGNQERKFSIKITGLPEYFQEDFKVVCLFMKGIQTSEPICNQTLC